MARFVRSTRFSLWLAVAVIVGLVMPSALGALPKRGSWIAVSDPVPLGSAAVTALRLPDITSVQGALTEPFAETEETSTSASGAVMVQVTVRPSDTPTIPIIPVIPGDDPERELVRVAGADRYETALEASRDFEKASIAVLATGANWPDALGGTALAGAVRGPLLLTRPNELPAAVRDELRRLGVARVYILGGTGAVSNTVQSALWDMGLVVERLGGADRYATGKLVADKAIEILGASYTGDALVATGTNFPDATGGSALAAALGRPILLVRPTGEVYVPAATRRVTILGGTGAVSAQVEVALQRQLGAGNVVRAGGADRYETAAKIAEVGVAAGMTWDGLGVATGADFPDALSGGAMLGAHNSVLLLTRPTVLSAEAEARLVDNADDIDRVHIFGGTGAVSLEAEDAVRRITGLF